MAHYVLPVGSGGFLGVDVFFVISGFLITRLIINEQKTDRFSYFRFYIRRARRLLPAALSVIGASLLVFIPILNSNDLSDFLKSVPQAILPLANIYFYNSVGYFDTDAIAKPFLHFWSLAVEEQFYFVWPTMLLLALRFFSRYTNIVGWTLLLAYYLLPYRAFELMVGAQLAIIMRDKLEASHYIATPNSLVIDSCLALIGFALIGFSFFFISEHHPLPGLLSLVPCLGAALLIRFGDAGPVGRILKNRVTVWIGLISYSLYLVHWPIYVYVAYRVPFELSLWLKLSLFPIAILIASLNYYLVEKRLRTPTAPTKRFGNVPMLGGIALFAALLLVPTYLKHSDRSFGVRSADREIEGATQYSNLTKFRWDGLSESREVRRYQSNGPNQEMKRVLLLGDSHANHLETGFVHLLTPQGISFDAATLAGCPPFFSAVRFYNFPNRGKAQKLCTEASLGAKEKLASLDEYDAVILAARWFNLVEFSDFGDLAIRNDFMFSVEDASDYEYGVYKREATEENTSVDREVFVRHLNETLSALEKLGKNVVIFSQVPEVGNDLSRCMTLFPWTLSKLKSEGAASRCSQMSGEERLQRSKFVDEAIKRAAREHGALAVIPTDLFCAEDKSSCFEPLRTNLVCLHFCCGSWALPDWRNR